MPSAVITKTYGTVSADRQKEMSGLEFVQGLVNGTLPLNMIAQTLGYDVIEAEKGRVVVALEPSEAHLNPYGTIHGGLTATLLDSCMGLGGAIDPRQGRRADNGRVQDFADTAYYAGNRTHQRRGHCVELRPARWHRRGSPHRWQGTLARAWHDHVPDFCQLTAPKMR